MKKLILFLVASAYLFMINRYYINKNNSFKGCDKLDTKCRYINKTDYLSDTLKNGYWEKSFKRFNDEEMRVLEQYFGNKKMPKACYYSTLKDSFDLAILLEIPPQLSIVALKFNENCQIVKHKELLVW